jgi:hypothetical protein
MIEATCVQEGKENMGMDVYRGTVAVMVRGETTPSHPA